MAIQVLTGTSAIIQETFQVDGVPTDLDTGVPTVTITRPDGTAGPASGTVTHVGSTGSGTYQFVLTAQSVVTVLAITWVGTIGGQQQTLASTVEVVGAFLYTLAAVRAVKVGGTAPFNATDYPNQLLLDRRAEVTDDFEAKTGWSFVPRFTRERHSGDGTPTLVVRQYKPGSLLSVTVDGASQTLADFDLDADGVLTWHAGTFPATRPANVAVEYVRGFDRPPAKISSDALAVTASWLLPPEVGSASVWTTPDGTTYSFDPAGRALSGGGTAFYGIPKVDADLNSPAYSARGGGVFA